MEEGGVKGTVAEYKWVDQCVAAGKMVPMEDFVIKTVDLVK